MNELFSPAGLASQVLCVNGLHEFLNNLQIDKLKICHWNFPYSHKRDFYVSPQALKISRINKFTKIRQVLPICNELLIILQITIATPGGGGHFHLLSR